MNIDNKSTNFGKYLYLGCGNHRLQKFTHVEISLAKNKSGPPDIIADISQHIDLPKEHVDLIFSRGTMEHLKYAELINCFIENFRLLKKGGVVRMVVPSFDLMIKRYLNKQTPHETAYREMATFDNEYERMPIENYSDYFVAQVLYHDHYYLHNFETLRGALSKCGFINIRKADPGDTIVKDVSDVLYEAEIGRDEFEFIVEAQKGEDKPTAKKIKRPLPKNLILYLLAKFFNIELTKHVKRAPVFPQLKWFTEKALNIYNPYRGKHLDK